MPMQLSGTPLGGPHAADARRLFTRVAPADEFVDFLTLPADELID